MKDIFRNSLTAANLAHSFLNESHAKMRYEYYAREAEKEGYIQIRDIFTETANNESEHAKRFYKFLNEYLCGEKITIPQADLPITLSDTKSNLKSAIEGESDESSYMYPLYSEIAKKEGYDEISYVFQEIGEAEEAHQARFEKLLHNLETGMTFKRDEEVQWKCNNCGYLHTGTEAPEECPACAHGQEFFELFVETY